MKTGNIPWHLLNQNLPPPNLPWSIKRKATSYTINPCTNDRNQSFRSFFYKSSHIVNCLLFRRILMQNPIKKKKRASSKNVPDICSFIILPQTKSNKKARWFLLCLQEMYDLIIRINSNSKSMLPMTHPKENQNSRNILCG